MAAMLRTVAAMALFLTSGSLLAQAPKSSETTAGVEAEPETARFVRPAGKGFEPETEIRIQKTAGSFVVTSITRRPDQTLTLTSEFDAGGGLRDAAVNIRDGDQTREATATVADGMARVVRKGKPPAVLKCPGDAIVTSAPDWTDAFFIARRYVPQGSKEQTFEGLWIHPTRDPLRLTFSAARTGTDIVNHQGRNIALSRLRLLLRNQSRYIAWCNNDGQLVRLVPEGSPQGGIVLARWEEAATGLKP